MPTPPIPPITNPELHDAVSALTSAANSYRVVFLDLMDRLITTKGGENKHVQYVFANFEKQLDLSNAVIDTWRLHLGPPKEDTGRRWTSH
jgi:hypothetical protein